MNIAERDNQSVKIGINLFDLFTLRDSDLKIMRFNFDRVYVKFPYCSNNDRATLFSAMAEQSDLIIIIFKNVQSPEA